MFRRLGGVPSEPVESPIRVRIDLAYDGTDFSGWARQPGRRTVQGVLEGALATVFSRFPPAPTLVVAGRTDAGVHASGQVAHLDLSAGQRTSLARPARSTVTAGEDRDPAAVLERRVNGVLGADSDVVVLGTATAQPGFDARFSAVWRRYEYRIADATGPRNPLERRTTWRVASMLDVDAMNDAAAMLVGLHDWAAYCKPRDGATTIRTLQEFRFSRRDGVIVGHVKADAFCHSMVRSLVGAAVAVGEGRMRAGRMLELRDERARTSEFPVAPARGLTLVEVGYPPDAELAARAEQTRAHRAPVE